MANVTVRFWAGARAAAGHDEEELQAGAVGDVVQQLARRDAGLAEVLAVSSLLVDGLVARPSQTLADGDVVEVLPPFAGG